MGSQTLFCFKPAFVAVLCIFTIDPALALAPVFYLYQQLRITFTSPLGGRRHARPRNVDLDF